MNDSEKNMVSLDEVIRGVFKRDAERTCPPEMIARVLNGFCDKLVVRGLETSETVEKMREHFNKSAKTRGV